MTYDIRLMTYWKIIRRLNVSRIINILKIAFSYYLSRLIGKPLMFGYPFSISVEPTTSCNLRCPECISGIRGFTRKTGMLTIETYKNILGSSEKWLMYLNYYFQGEPFLNPEIYEMIKMASEKGIYTSTSTNAHYLTMENCKKIIDSGLSRLIISIDGTTPEVYSAYRIGGSYEKVMEGLKMLKEVKEESGARTPMIIIQFIVFRQNEHQVPSIKKLSKELGFKLWIKSAQINEFEAGSDLMPESEKYSRYIKQEDGKYSIKNNLLNHCWKLWHSLVFTWDGKAVPCCFDKDAKHAMGDIHQTSLEKIWYDSPYNDFRKMLIHSRARIDICRNCSEGTNVFTLE